MSARLFLTIKTYSFVIQILISSVRASDIACAEFNVLTRAFG